MKSALLILLSVLGVGAVATAADFTVINTNDSGPGSLYQAIADANALPGPDRIVFNIPGSGVRKIHISTQALPSIDDTVTIDGYTQPGASPNTLQTGDDATILIQLDGQSFSFFPVSSTGLFINAENCVVRGLMITAFPPTSDPYIGSYGGYGIVIVKAGCVVEGNFIGTDGSSATTLGNYTSGVWIGAPTARVGGDSPAARNVISGNGKGILIANSGSGAIIQGNLIGTQANGQDPLGNRTGIEINGAQNLVGALDETAGNTIAYNKGPGVAVLPGGAAVGNSILSNRIYSNTGLPIDLGATLGNGPTSNDLGDGDDGPNKLQNFPIITATASANTRDILYGELDSTSSTNFTLQFFFYNLAPRLLGSLTVTTDATGHARFEFPFFPGPGPIFEASFYSATATDAAGNTSEFLPKDGPIQLANISTRGDVRTGDNILIGGFVIHSPGSKKVIIRALGPSLNVPSRLADPYLELYDDRGALLAKNDDWKTGQQQEVMDSGVPPSSDVESAIVISLSAGSYTAQVRGVNGGTGTGIVEVYDLGNFPSDPGRLVNISTRGLVGTNDNALIGGFIVRGDNAESVIIRAIGPDLTAVGVPGALQDPTLELRDSSGTLLASNNDWRDTQETEIMATQIPPNDNRDSAILASLAPGYYTAIVRGRQNTTGLAIVEFYDLKQ